MTTNAPRLLQSALLLGTLSLGLSACTVAVQTSALVQGPVVRFVPERGQGANYFLGERVRFSLSTRASGYVTIRSIDPNGRSYLLVQNAFVGAGTTSFPRFQDGEGSYTLVPPRGIQRVTATFTPADNSYAGSAYAPSQTVETFFYIR